jgi:release factor glutamine methyltransferase
MKKIFARQLQQQLGRQILEGRSDIYSEAEVQQISQLLLEHFLHLGHQDVLLNRELEINSQSENLLQAAVARLHDFEPVQYITGTAYFYGRPFYVSPSVLIPRRETEELTHLLIHDNQQPGLRLMDIGTGSGCIAITLATELTGVEVHAVDVSQEALSVAKANAKRHGANIQWHLHDILQEPPPVSRPMDIIISNPPYVRKSEAADMHRNVLDFEPYSALFVDDENPLIFYEQILKSCITDNLVRGGSLIYMEINEYLGEQTLALFERYGMQNTVLQKDMQEKNRIIRANFPA